MSTLEGQINQLIKDNKLFEYAPGYPPAGFKASRKLYMSEEVILKLPPKEESAQATDRIKGKALDRARVQMNSFVGGRNMEEEIDITFLTPPPDNIWEIKVVPDGRDKQVRVFGWFVGYDTFVCTHVEERDDLGTRGTAKDRWQEAMDKCDKKRSKLYKDLPTFSCGRDIHKYLSNAGAALRV